MQARSSNNNSKIKDSRSTVSKDINNDNDKKDIYETKKTTAKGNKRNLFEDISLKEISVLLGGIIIIFALLFIIPNLSKEQPKTMDELFSENYNKAPTDNSYIYNSYSFLRLSDEQTNVDFWYTQYQIEENMFIIPFRFGPKEVENISVNSINPIPKKDYTKMYITIDPKDPSVSRPYLTLAVSEMSEVLKKVKSYNLISACSENVTDACKSRPIVTCDSNEDDLVVYFQEDQEEKIEIDGNCFIIYGTDETIIRSTDRMLYGLLGIMQ
ncbi:hypothetical protein H6503_02000 [Candidatus Woesearchaeota archaeon]|nr:hypothetical protein [Candidatus Woesearchaeota archaeon]